MSQTTVTITGLAICFAILVFLAFFGNRFDAAIERRKKQKMLRRENAKPLLICNGGTQYKVGQMRVVVWAVDFFRFAAEQAKTGSNGMYYAPKDSPAAVFTKTGLMPDSCAATGTFDKFEAMLLKYGNKVRVEYRYDLFIPQLNEKYADLVWQKKNCGIIEPRNLEQFASRFYKLTHN